MNRKRKGIREGTRARDYYFSKKGNNRGEKESGHSPKGEKAAGTKEKQLNNSRAGSQGKCVKRKMGPLDRRIPKNHTALYMVASTWGQAYDGRTECMRKKQKNKSGLTKFILTEPDGGYV